MMSIRMLRSGYRDEKDLFMKTKRIKRVSAYRNIAVSNIIHLYKDCVTEFRLRISRLSVHINQFDVELNKNVKKIWITQARKGDLANQVNSYQKWRQL